MLGGNCNRSSNSSSSSFCSFLFFCVPPPRPCIMHAFWSNTRVYTYYTHARALRERRLSCCALILTFRPHAKGGETFCVCERWGSFSKSPSSSLGPREGVQEKRKCVGIKYVYVCTGDLCLKSASRMRPREREQRKRTTRYNKC